MLKSVWIRSTWFQSLNRCYMVRPLRNQSSYKIGNLYVLAALLSLISIMDMEGVVNNEQICLLSFFAGLCMRSHAVTHDAKNRVCRLNTLDCSNDWWVMCALMRMPSYRVLLYPLMRLVTCCDCLVTGDHSLLFLLLILSHKNLVTSWPITLL